MKALDTSALLALLHGDKSAKELVRTLRGVEVATTEANLVELLCLQGRGPGRSRNARREAIDRMRRSLTILPIDNRATDRLLRRNGRGDVSGTPASLLSTLAALEANGCEELFTSDPTAVSGHWSFRVTGFGSHNRK